MSNYVKATNFRTKDSLVVGDPNKRVKGAEIDDEFVAIATAISSKADTASPTFTGTPTAPTATSGTNNNQLATTAFVISNSVPMGAILMWSGAIGSLPTGYSLCDGTGGTPDLRNRFIVGAGSTYSIGATGGNKDAAVIVHNHISNHSEHSHGIVANRKQSSALTNDGSGETYLGWDSVGITTNSTASTGSTNTTGESGVDKNLPPYYALAYIMRTA